MSTPLLPTWSDVPRPVIGMIHAPPLVGAPRFGGDLPAIQRAVVDDARALADGGVHGLMLENFGDVPFFAGAVPAETVAHLTALALAVREAVDLPLGLNVLRNDARSALAIAKVVGASYARVNVLAGVMVTDQGLIEGRAAEVLRYRATIGAEDVRLLADVRVKHAAALADRPMNQEVADLVERAGAEALIVTGPGTGEPTEAARVRAVKQAVAKAGAAVPVFVGSGATAETVAALAEHADGFIVGTHFKRGGRVDEPVDIGRVQRFMASLR